MDQSGCLLHNTSLFLGLNFDTNEEWWVPETDTKTNFHALLEKSFPSTKWILRNCRLFIIHPLIVFVWWGGWGIPGLLLYVTQYPLVTSVCYSAFLGNFGNFRTALLLLCTTQVCDCWLKPHVITAYCPSVDIFCQFLFGANVYLLINNDNIIGSSHQ